MACARADIAYCVRQMMINIAFAAPADHPLVRAQFDFALRASPLPALSLGVFEPSPNDMALIDAFLEAAMLGQLVRLLIQPHDLIERWELLSTALHTAGWLKSKVCTLANCSARFTVFYPALKRVCDVSAFCVCRCFCNSRYFLDFFSAVWPACQALARSGRDRGLDSDAIRTAPAGSEASQAKPDLLHWCWLLFACECCLIPHHVHCRRRRLDSRVCSSDSGCFSTTRPPLRRLLPFAGPFWSDSAVGGEGHQRPHGTVHPSAASTVWRNQSAITTTATLRSFKPTSCSCHPKAGRQNGNGWLLPATGPLRAPNVQSWHAHTVTSSGRNRSSSGPPS